MSSTLLLVRHGETELNQAGALRGRLDIPLTPRGAREAEAVGRRIAAEYEVTAISSSPLLRARQTAEKIGAACGMPVANDARFVDIDYGSWAGKPLQEMAEEEARSYLRWLRNPAIPLPGAENPQAVEKRVIAGLEEIASSGASCVVVVSHDAILQLVVRHVLGLPLGTYRGIAQHTGTLNELRRTERGWTLRLLNSGWHLEASAVSLQAESGISSDRRPAIRETSAGGAVFYHDLVLLLQLLNGDWVLPKGRLEDAEEPEQAASREVQEETGVRPQVIAPIDATAYTFRAEGGTRRKTVYWYAMRADQPDVRPPTDEFAAAAWTTVEDACQRLRWAPQRDIVRQGLALTTARTR